MKNKSSLPAVRLKQLALALSAAGFSSVLIGCGGGGSDAAVTPPPPPPPTVSIDVFGARGGYLTAIVSSTNCSATPTVSWATTSGVAAGTGTSIQDNQPNAALVATATCSTATSNQTLAANAVYAGSAAFAVMQNGSAVAWGNPVWGGNTSTAAAITNISQVIPSERGFAALLADGTVKTWGSSFVAVSDPNLAYPATGAIATDPLTNVATVIPGKIALFAIKKDGTVAAWGRARGLGGPRDFPMTDQVYGFSPAVKAAMTGVKTIVANEGSYAALKNDGTVVTFGNPDTGGDSSYVKAILTNVTQIVGGNFDFLALRKDGTVVNWGYGYASSGDQSIPVPNATDVTKLFMNGYAGAAINSKNEAFAFGYTPQIDSADTKSIASQLTNVSNIFATESAFAALKSDGSVVAWGDSVRMNDSLTKVQASLTNVKSIATSEYAFAALKGDGTVVTWGDAQNGGDSSSVAANLNKVVAITANKYAFAALKSDGTVVTWGMGSKGGDSASVASKLVNIRAIYATPFGAFLAIAKDGSYVTWGDAWVGGDSSAIASKLTKITYAN